MATPRLIACHDCDLLHRTPEVPEGGAARCRRCGGVLVRRKRNSIERTLALAIAALVLFAGANWFPFLKLEMQGDFAEMTLISGVQELYAQEMRAVALLVLMTTIVAPALQIVLLIYVLLPLHFGHRPWAATLAFRWLRKLSPWSMLDVLLLGVLVSVVKLADMADVYPGIAMWSFALLIPALAATSALLDHHAVWEELWEAAA